jgi:hypothetical protein
MLAKLRDLAVGQAFPVGIAGTAADLARLQGSTIVGVASLNSGAASAPVNGVWFEAPDADGFIGVVPFPGSLLTAAGKVEGTVTVTKADEVWSPDVLRFSAPVEPHV